MENKNIVGAVKCSDYLPENLAKAIKEACALSFGSSFSGDRDKALATFANIVSGKNILLKPNMLFAVSPEEKPVTTHHEFVKQCILLFKEMGAAAIYVGDSPGYQSTEYAGKKSGIASAVKEAGGIWTDFSDGIQFKNPEGKLVKSFNLASIIEKVDLVVSLPKMKTHQLLYYTGAIKNLFGLVPGIQKSAFHLRFPEKELFSEMLVDLNIAVKPFFAIMDSITAMEGHGPGSGGKPRHVGAVLASTNLLALDIAASTIMGYKAEELPLISHAIDRKLWLSSVDDFTVAGEKLENLIVPNFKKIKNTKDISFCRNKLPGFLFEFIRNAAIPRPVINKTKCIKCQGCVKICPATAIISSADHNLTIDYSKCITCYCCHEVCPEKAIHIKRKIF